MLGVKRQLRFARLAMCVELTNQPKDVFSRLQLAAQFRLLLLVDFRRRLRWRRLPHYGCATRNQVPVRRHKPHPACDANGGALAVLPRLPNAERSVYHASGTPQFLSRNPGGLTRTSARPIPDLAAE